MKPSRQARGRGPSLTLAGVPVLPSHQAVSLERNARMRCRKEKDRIECDVRCTTLYLIIRSSLGCREKFVDVRKCLNSSDDFISCVGLVGAHAHAVHSPHAYLRVSHFGTPPVLPPARDVLCVRSPSLNFLFGRRMASVGWLPVTRIPSMPNNVRM